MVNLKDLLDLKELDRMIDEGRISKQVHPNLPISILNYSSKAQYIGEWSQSERVCRGLIVEDHTGDVIARGPEKFFNYGQSGAPEVPLDTKVRVTYKEDGSLGISWTYDGHYGVATRGSFTSEQAVHATSMLTDHMCDVIGFRASKGKTEIYEIVYPGNRIVLDYGDRDELIRLGSVDNRDGLIQDRFMNNLFKGEGDWLESLKVMTLEKALSLQIPDDEEGYVVDLIGEDNKTVTGHVKLKGNEYKILHGLLTNTNARRIWVELAWRACHRLLPEDKPQLWAFLLGNDPEDFKRVNVNKSIEETFLEKVPDEFYGWVTKQIDTIYDNVYSLLGQAKVLAEKIKEIENKRERFETVKGHPLVTEILRYVETGDESGMTLRAWKLAYPGDEKPFKTNKEED